jgi:hypothetical protein
MTLPTVIEITPQLEPVTRDTFIDRFAEVARATDEPRYRTAAAAERERASAR